MWKMCVHLPLTPTLALMLSLPTLNIPKMNVSRCKKLPTFSKVV
jgi:hypothetical protein